MITRRQAERMVRADDHQLIHETLANIGRAETHPEYVRATPQAERILTAYVEWGNIYKDD